MTEMSQTTHGDVESAAVTWASRASACLPAGRVAVTPSTLLQRVEEEAEVGGGKDGDRDEDWT